MPTICPLDMPAEPMAPKPMNWLKDPLFGGTIRVEVSGALMFSVANPENDLDAFCPSV